MVSTIPPIPVTIITGFLGSGKTTLILNLIPQLATICRLALLKNEFSDVNLAIRYSEAGRRPEALQLTEQVVQLRKTKPGEDHPYALQTMEFLAYISERNGGISQRPIAARQSRYQLSRLWRLIRSWGWLSVKIHGGSSRF